MSKAKPEETERSPLERFVGEHPGFGKMSSRDGEPYNPVNLPNDPSTAIYLNQFPGQAEMAAPEPEAPEASVAPEPAPEPVVASNASGPPAEERQEERRQLLFGKYRSMEEAERGWQERERVLQERNRENIALKAAQAAIEPIREALTQARREPEPQRPTGIPVQFDEQGRAFIPGELVAEMSRRAAAEAAQARLNEVLTPMQAMNTAYTQARSRFSDFTQHEAEFTQYLQEHPEVAQRVGADPEFALNAAYLMFREQRGADAREATEQTTQSARQQVAAVRQHAAAPSGAPSGRQTTAAEERNRRIREAYEQGLRSGDMRPWARARLTEALDIDGSLSAIAKSGWGR